MKTEKEYSGQEGRKNFLKLGLVLAAGTMIGRWGLKSFGKKSISAQLSGKKVKMLAADGTLVEVDQAVVRKVKKVTNEELFNWVKKPKV